MLMISIAATASSTSAPPSNLEENVTAEPDAERLHYPLPPQDARFQRSPTTSQLRRDPQDHITSQVISASTEWEEKKSESLDDLVLQKLLSNAMIGNPIIHANAMIDTLSRITVVMRPAWSASLAADRYDRARQSELENADFFRLKDEAELTTDFPQLDPWLRQRLLSASLQRRLLLQYTWACRQKLLAERIGTTETGNDGGEGVLVQDEITPGDAGSTISRPALSISSSAIRDGEPLSPRSETSSISSASTTISGPKHRYPPFPAENKNDFRMCLACCLFLYLPTERHWRSVLQTPADVR